MLYGQIADIVKKNQDKEYTLPQLHLKLGEVDYYINVFNDKNTVPFLPQSRVVEFTIVEVKPGKHSKEIVNKKGRATKALSLKLYPKLKEELQNLNR